MLLAFQQTRRKLEDVGRKLEILYDKLRDQSVSTSSFSLSGALVFCYGGRGYFLVLFFSCLSWVVETFSIFFQLPPATLDGLHSIASSALSHAYPHCLATVNQLVSTGSFALLAEFLPGVKVLLQVASQLGVYITAADK